MKLSTATGSFPSNSGGEAKVYQAIAEAGYSYINYNFPNFSQTDPTYMDYMQENYKGVAKTHLECMKKAGLTPIQAHGPFAYPLDPCLKEAFVKAYESLDRY